MLRQAGLGSAWYRNRLTWLPLSLLLRALSRGLVVTDASGRSAVSPCWSRLRSVAVTAAMANELLIYLSPPLARRLRYSSRLMTGGLGRSIFDPVAGGGMARTSTRPMVT